MELLLTLVIVVGGIATGIGAIWAALVARRQAQLSERSMTQTERSLAQTERSLAEQAQNLREQNQRARLSLEWDLLTRLQDESRSPYLLSCRRESAKYFLDNALVEDDTVEPPQSLLSATLEMCDFFETVGELLRVGVLRTVPVWNSFSYMAQGYWLPCKPAIEKRREEWQDPTLYEEFEYLYLVTAEMDRKRGVAPPPRELLRRFFEAEAVVGNEPQPRRSSDDICRSTASLPNFREFLFHAL